MACHAAEVTPDPADVLVNGWDGRYSDLAFLAVGVFFIVFGLGIAFGN